MFTYLEKEICKASAKNTLTIIEVQQKFDELREHAAAEKKRILGQHRWLSDIMEQAASRAHRAVVSGKSSESSSSSASDGESSSSEANFSSLFSEGDNDAVGTSGADTPRSLGASGAATTLPVAPSIAAADTASWPAVLNIAKSYFGLALHDATIFARYLVGEFVQDDDDVVSLVRAGYGVNFEELQKKGLSTLGCRRVQAVLAKIATMLASTEPKDAAPLAPLPWQPEQPAVAQAAASTPFRVALDKQMALEMDVRARESAPQTPSHAAGADVKKEKTQ